MPRSAALVIGSGAVRFRKVQGGRAIAAPRTTGRVELAEAQKNPSEASLPVIGCEAPFGVGEGEPGARHGGEE